MAIDYADRCCRLSNAKKKTTHAQLQLADLPATRCQLLASLEKKHDKQTTAEHCIHVVFVLSEKQRFYFIKSSYLFTELLSLWHAAT